MDKVRITKTDLLDVLRENREKHRRVFLDSLEGYRLAAIGRLDEQIAMLKEGRTPELRIILSRPQDHTRDYDRVIRMLEMHQADSYELDESDFAQYVEDDWAWKRDWLRMSNSYAAVATQAAYGAVEE